MNNMHKDRVHRQDDEPSKEWPLPGEYKTNFGESDYSLLSARGGYHEAAEIMAETYHRDHSGRGPKNYRRSDERILEDVVDLLMLHRDIDASNMDISSQDGVVVLTGEVGSKAMKYLTEDAIEHVVGVKDVKNDLQVKPQNER